MSSMSCATLSDLLECVRACDRCAAYLPLGPRPILQAGAAARLLIIGQAPGLRAHISGRPWDDASGERLRDWLGVERDCFYDENRLAIVPMGFCYPGRGSGGDNPPRPECAPLWHARVLAMLPQVQLTLLIGSYAQAAYLKQQRKPTLTQTVAAWRDYAPRYLPLPHPSPRNQAWFKLHPWFGQEVLPQLRVRVPALLETPQPGLQLPSVWLNQKAANAAWEKNAMDAPDIEIERLYHAKPRAGRRVFLVDRLWPRGIRKEELAGVVWAREVAPSAGLRKWWHGCADQAAHWDEFVQRYRAELDGAPEAWQPLASASLSQPVLLYYGGHDTQHNNAAVLRDYLLEKRARL